MGVSPHFHETLNVPVVRGRDFTDAEGWARTPYAIVNETMARRFWPDADALGGRFRMLDNREAPDRFTVIGVAPDIKHEESRSRRPALGLGLCAVRLSTDAQHRTDDPRGWRTVGDHRGGSRANPRSPIRTCRSSRPARWRKCAVSGSGNTRCSAGSSGPLGSSGCCSPRSACTACCRTRSRSARRRSASASRSAPRAATCSG